MATNPGLLLTFSAYKALHQGALTSDLGSEPATQLQGLVQNKDAGLFI